MTEFSYARYLSAKRTVDDRSLNHHVIERLRTERARLPGVPRVLELGAGLGTMVARTYDWRLFDRADYTCLDVDPALIESSREWLTTWARERGVRCVPEGETLRLGDESTAWTVRFVVSDVGEYVESSTTSDFDVLIANAFLDIVNVPELLPHLLRLLSPNGVYWFAINFDGETIFVPELPDDERLIGVYHRSMDERFRLGVPSGDSKTGRHLLGHLRSAGATVLAVGASDWVVQGSNFVYEADERYFLESIVHTIDAELQRHPEVQRDVLTSWVKTRLEQIDRGELVLIAHQLDLLGRLSAR